MVSKFQTGKLGGRFLLPLAALLLAANTFAQGLGNLVLESNLNEHLQAHIILLDVDKFDASQIQASLASTEEFAAANVERNSVLDSVIFNVAAAPGGGLQINLSSNQNIEEPYLTLLVNVRWPSGRSLREYTILLNLPGQPRAEAIAPTPISAPAATPDVGGQAVAAPTTVARAPSTNAATVDNAVGYVVKAGDTAYRIAAETRPNKEVSVQQMMLALQRANEDAFVNNNINRILSGRVLRIPSVDEVHLIEQDAAVAQIAQQTRELGSQTLTANSKAAGGSPSAKDELSILNGNQNGQSVASSDLNATIASLENELMVSEEGVDRARLENLDLTNRLSALQEQIELLQNIISIEDERIAQLQVQLGKQLAAGAQKTVNSESSKQEPAPLDSSRGLVDMLQNSVMILGGLLALAVAAVVALLVRRRNAAFKQSEMAETPLAANPIQADDVEESSGIGAKIRAILKGGFFANLFNRKEPSFDQELEMDQSHQEPDVAASEDEVAAVSEPSTETFAAVDLDPEVEATAPDELALHNEDLVEAAMALSEADLLEQELSDAELVIPPELEISETVIAEPIADVADESSAEMPVATIEDAVKETIDATEEKIEEVEEKIEEVEEKIEEEGVEETAEEKAEEKETDEELSDEGDSPELFEFSLPDFDDEEPSEEASRSEPLVSTTKATVETIEPSAAKDAGDKDEVSLVFDDTALSFEDEDLGEEEGDASLDSQDARLDLAVAYEAMGDIDGAVEILEEVIANGKPAQIEEAQRLKVKWQSS